jgi:hypothetical protein
LRASASRSSILMRPFYTKKDYSTILRGYLRERPLFYCFVLTGILCLSNAGIDAELLPATAVLDDNLRRPAKRRALKLRIILLETPERDLDRTAWQMCRAPRTQVGDEDFPALRFTMGIRLGKCKIPCARLTASGRCRVD